MAFSSVSVVTNSLRLRNKSVGHVILNESGDELLNEVKNLNTSAEETSQALSITRQYQVKGMMCKHCVGRVERALNSVEGLKAEVSLEPPFARIEFTDKPLTLEELQHVLNEKAGDYQITE
jgi:Cu2+-exporting ATPase